MNRSKAFTLIELLVVVAIIGILAAVGVVAYNGYTKSAKTNVVKSNHAAFVKKVSLIIQECNLYGSVNLMKKWNDTTLYNIACYSPNKWDFFAFSGCGRPRNPGRPPLHFRGRPVNRTV